MTTTREKSVAVMDQNQAMREIVKDLAWFDPNHCLNVDDMYDLITRAKDLIESEEG